MDDTTRAVNWLITNDDSFDVNRAQHDAGRLWRLYEKYDKHSRLTSAQFVQCIAHVRAIKVHILLSSIR